MTRYEAEQILGKKPDCTLIHPEEPLRDRLYADAMRYAHGAFEPKELKAFALAYLKRDDMRELPDYHFAVLGQVAWIHLEGGVLNESNLEWIQRKLAEIERSVANAVTDDGDAEFEPSARQRDVRAYVDLYSSLERMVAAGAADANDVRELINRHNVKMSILRQTLAHFEESLVDARADSITKWIAPLMVIVAELHGRVYNQKVARQAGRKVGTKVARVIKNVKFKQQDTTYNLVSVNPADVVGAKAAVTFNTKTKRANFYMSAGKLDVSGTTIKGFDEKLSYSKGLRNTSKDLESIKNATTLKRVETIMDQYVSGKRLAISGRLNEDTIIVKVF